MDIIEIVLIIYGSIWSFMGVLIFFAVFKKIIESNKQEKRERKNLPGIRQDNKPVCEV
jgi:hypothetical protein